MSNQKISTSYRGVPKRGSEAGFTSLRGALHMSARQADVDRDELPGAGEEVREDAIIFNPYALLSKI